jgi:hypothetical protein
MRLSPTNVIRRMIPAYHPAIAGRRAGVVRRSSGDEGVAMRSATIGLASFDDLAATKESR